MTILEGMLGSLILERGYLTLSQIQRTLLSVYLDMALDRRFHQ